MDAYAWKRFCSSFTNATQDLCSALVSVGRRICSSPVHFLGLGAFTACRLIPGVRPIEMGEVPRQIIAKALLQLVSHDIEKAEAGPLQVCARQKGGCEAAVHSMRHMFQDSNTEGVLLVDATNAFNSINRQAVLHNIRMLCPLLAQILINTYQSPIKIIIPGKGEIASTEETTQGHPLGMAMYALAIIPLIRKLHSSSPEVSQIWFAVDDTSAGSCSHLKLW